MKTKASNQVLKLKLQIDRNDEDENINDENVIQTVGRGEGEIGQTNRVKISIEQI